MQKITKIILDYFEQINAIPRCSLNEARLCQWLQDWADGHGWSYINDAAGNLLVQVPASLGYDDAPTLVLQGHMDMVCEKTPESYHDFSNDPIRSKMDGDWLTADNTTLGADNGIALAFVMALAEEESVGHPHLELLFTVDEESGLNGAKKLQPDFISGKSLINLDSEDEGVFTVGCAGGVDTTLSIDLQQEPMLSNSRPYMLVVGGLKGGHSGIDIHKHRGNANKILARTLVKIRNVTEIRIAELDGGTRFNAIPRDAKAIILIDSLETTAVEKSVQQILSEVRKEYTLSESDLFINITPADEVHPKPMSLTLSDTDRTIRLLLALPNGVAGMSPDFQGSVETSSNLATVAIADGKLSIISSQRSSAMSRLEEITATVHAIAGLAGATASDKDAFPVWPSSMRSSLLTRSKKVYEGLFDQEPIVQVIHAGLECGVLGDLYAGMDMISFGPTIRNPHSPDERLYIPSIEKLWYFLVALLEDLKDH